MYTQKELESKSDKDLNKLVYEAEGLKPSSNDLIIEETLELMRDSDPLLRMALPITDRYYGKDYCNNWSDMGPIIDKHEITMKAPNYNQVDHWEVSSCIFTDGLGFCYGADHKNPLRAAAIVYLLMHHEKCDGNHGGPKCSDPECWNDDKDGE